MNEYLVSTVRLINMHGKNMTYSVVTEGSYDVETGSTTNTETSYTLKMYKKHLKATQYYYPNLIGKDSATFYLANYNLSFVPAVRDKITNGSETYVVDSVKEHSALGQVILYKIVAVKG